MINININLFKGIVNEEWRPIEGFSDYMVSDKGRIKSLKWGKQRILKQKKGTHGYLEVTLWNKGIKETKTVHRLVAEAFLGKPDDFLEVNHKNGVKSDNRLENLEWVSHAENIHHADNIGLRNIKGENHPGVKLTAETVLKIVDDLNTGFPQQEIAEKYKVSPRQIRNIKSGRCWSSVTGITPEKPRLKIPGEFTPITINLNINIGQEAI